MQINYCFGCMESTERYPCPHCGYAPSGNASAYTLHPGTILRGKYLVGKVLGQGGFGITYIGMDLALQRKVAIKEFYPASCVGRESGTNRVLWYDTLQAQNAMQSGQETFLKEARKMSRISNIGTVVHVFDVFQENETAYICMEFIEGQTLQQLLKQTGPLPWEKARKIFLPVIQTMAEVHRQGLVHRDLSPDNLMIQRDGTVKILDLGAAKDLNLNTGVSSMQVAKSGFSPLEQYLSSGESGSWTDVYALAATLYYALTGVVPPTAVDRSNRDTLRRDLPQLQALPPEVRKALNHAMAVRKDDRTWTMDAFTQELQQKIPYWHDNLNLKEHVFNIINTLPDFFQKLHNKISWSLQYKKIYFLPLIAAILATISIIIVIVFVSSIIKSSNTMISVSEPTESISEIITDVPETIEPLPKATVPVPEHVVATATIISTGDILMHKPVIDANYSNGNYNFDSIFHYIAEDITAADYAVANLETTLAGTTNGYQYSGYPNFNCPDTIVDGAKNAGFDMLLNANNHSYDTSSLGMHRTIEIIRDRGLDNLGIVDKDEEKRYLVKEINGINIGMICYTYETDANTNQVTLDDSPVKTEDKNLINSFDYYALDTFYTELKGHLESMDADGAEASIVYIHWGNEYQLKENGVQQKIAQAICDMGVDVLIGGHPHVVQPMALLESTVDPKHKTVCLYSMGNAVSNQRQGNLTAITTAHTEDGVLFSVTFSKYSDGSVYLESTDLLPTWVYRRSDYTGNEFNIFPLHIEQADRWGVDFNIQDSIVGAAKNSHARTMSIVGEGLTSCQTYLQEQFDAREQYYYDLALNPEKNNT